MTTTYSADVSVDKERLLKMLFNYHNKRYLFVIKNGEDFHSSRYLEDNNIIDNCVLASMYRGITDDVTLRLHYNPYSLGGREMRETFEIAVLSLRS